MLPKFVMFFLFCFTLGCGVAPLSAADTVETGRKAKVVELDRIVAVVNNEVITRYEMNERMNRVLHQLKQQGTPLPARDVLEKQLLERMIADVNGFTTGWVTYCRYAA